MSRVQFAEHVMEQPDAVARLVAASGPMPALDAERPLVLTGIGTSLHAAQVAAVWADQLTGGRLRCAAVNSHDLAVSGGVQPQDQVVVISHRGTKRYPNAVLDRAAQVGATTVAVTGNGSADPAADVVLRTVPQERASTHTVSYTSALVVLAHLVARYVGADGDPLLQALAAVPDAMRRTLDLPPAEAAVDALVEADATPGIIAGTGVDAVTAAEAALKVKEGTFRGREGMHTEVALRGTPAVFRPGMVGYLIEPASDDGGRDADLAGFLRALGARVVRCGTDEDAGLRFAPCHPLARPFVTVLPFHQLVSAAATRVGSNPDLTHLEAEPWAGAFASIEL